jgi:HEAT repeat protein
MNPLPLLLLLASVARAGTVELVATAADVSLPDSERKVAFEKAKQAGDGTALVQIAEDPTADTRHRWVAIRLLGKVNTAIGQECLLRLISNEVPAIRAAAAAALGDAHRSGAAERVAALLDDPAIIVRGSAADALGSFRDARSVPYLVRALDDPTNVYRGASLWVRRHYVDALAAIGDKTANPVLVRCLDDKDPEVRQAGISALEAVNGLSWADGRTADEQRVAWQRWWANRK